MLKRLAIFGVLLAATHPMPGQAVKSAAQGGDQNQNQSQSNKAARAQSLALIDEPKHPPAADSHSGQVAAEDKDNSVKLTSLPPITIASQKKTFWDHVLDWGPWISNALLALLGILQVWLLLRTWKTIERQANIMEKQAKDAQESGAEATKITLATAQASQKSADAAMAQIRLIKDKERARLVFVPQPLNEIEMGSNGLGDTEIQIGNFGSTNAFNVRYGAWCEITHNKEEPFDPYPDYVIGVIRANADPERIQEGIVTNVSGPQIEANTRDLFVHLAGRVEYEDVFGVTLPAQNVSLSELLKWRKGNANEEWEAGQVHA